MMNMEKPELKPCPFCGGDGCLRTIRNTSFLYGGKPNHWDTYFVNCDNLGCPMNNAQEDGEMGGTLNDWKTKDDAIAAWNQRTPQQPQWEQMTEETKFEDGQFIVIRRSKHHGYHKIFAQWSSVHGRFFSNSTPVPVSVEDCFIRIPKY